MKFPSIEKFRHVIKAVERKVRFTGLNDDGYPLYDSSIPLPTLSLTGTVKLHGTNARVHFTNGEMVVGSRTRTLTPNDDNYGFAKFVHANEKYFKAIRTMIGDECSIFGEWVGQGILKGTAVHQLDPMLVIFAIRKDEKWYPITEYKHVQYPEARIYNIAQFPMFSIEIDFNAPKSSVSRLEELTSQVEAKCPVGAQLGVEGVGEGIVWTFDDPLFNSSDFWFKVKGEKHETSNTKQKVEVDVEKVNNINEFVDTVLTTPRLEQGLENIPELHRKHTGAYLKWVVNDVLKEETDRLEASGLDRSDVTKACSQKARDWLFEYLDTNV